LKKDEKNNKVSICPELEEGGKRADLEYKTLDYTDDLTLLEISLFTGRSHQIRVQLSSIGCPIVSDIKYGAKMKITKNLSLWAHKLSFNHPTKDERLSFECFPPVNDIPWKYFNIKTLK
jgi:23S rRNA pseudouridine1911/1915/1917 synthase